MSALLAVIFAGLAIGSLFGWGFAFAFWAACCAFCFYVFHIHKEG